MDIDTTNDNKKKIIDKCNKQQLENMLYNNQSVIIIQFTSTSCNPCKIIKKLIEKKFNECHETILCYCLDIEKNNELYSRMKRLRQTKGVPTLLAYFAGNITMLSDISISGIDENEINIFFNKCNHFANNL